MPKFNPKLDNGSYRTQFTINGKRQYHYFGTSDRAIADALSAKMKSDFALGRFDSSLESYKALAVTESSQTPSRATEKPSSASDKPLLELWDLWVDSLQLPEATKNNKYHWIRVSIVKASPKANDSNWFVNQTSISFDTWNERKGYLRRCFEWLIDNNHYQGKNPYKELKNRKGQKKDNIKPFSNDEIKAILQAFESNQFVAKSSRFPHSHYVPFVKFLFLTGVRLGEATALTWDCINWNDGFITIKQALGRNVESNPNATRKVIKGTKTNEIKYIPLNDELRALLSSLDQNTKFVFPGHHGSYIDTRTFRENVWKPVLEKLNIPYRYPYQARHTVLSHVAKTQGLMAAAKLAGHKSLDMVSRHYARYTDTIELPSLK